jgi:hypothetical protein
MTTDMVLTNILQLNKVKLMGDDTYHQILL